MRRAGAAGAILLLLAGCAAPEVAPPYWRRPGPAVTEPPPREPVPDQGFRAARDLPRAAQG